MGAIAPYDPGGGSRERFPMPRLSPPAGNRGAASKTADGGLFFAQRKLTRPQLQQDAETAFSHMEAGYTSAVPMIAEIAEIADQFGYDILAANIRRRLSIRLEGND